MTIKINFSTADSNNAIGFIAQAQDDQNPISFTFL
jgi:hypothetical protein